jgi:hypothetical protein
LPLQGLFFSFLGFQLLLVKLFKPSPYWLMVFGFWGLLIGLAMSYLFYANKKRKAEACEVVSGHVVVWAEPRAAACAARRALCTAWAWHATRCAVDVTSIPPAPCCQPVHPRHTAVPRMQPARSPRANPPALPAHMTARMTARTHSRRPRRRPRAQMGMNIGLKGLQHLLGNLPSWLSYTEREKIDWFNGILEEVWPYYDKGVCKMVKQMTEQIFEQQLKAMKVPGIKKVGFKQLTFGDAPFRVESIHVSDKRRVSGWGLRACWLWPPCCWRGGSFAAGSAARGCTCSGACTCGQAA